MADALLDEVLKANQIKAETIQFLTKDNENLKKHIAKIEDKNASLMEHNSILMAKLSQFKSVEANNQALEAGNQRLRSERDNATTEIIRLKSIISRNCMSKPNNSLNKKEQEKNIAFLQKELDETNAKAMEALRLMARNLNEAKQSLSKEKQKNGVLEATQEILKAIISDLKEENLQEKIEKNQFEKEKNQFKTQCANTTALFASFEPQFYQEPIVMECLPIPTPATGYLDNYRSTTRC